MTNWQKSGLEVERNSSLQNTNEIVGPGSYSIAVVDKKPKSQFIPRTGLRNRPHLYNNGSIKEGYVNFDEEIDFDDSTPGPG